MNNISEDINHENFLKAVQGQRFDLGGLSIDFSDDNQGSDLVSLTYLTENGFNSVDVAFLQQVFR